MEFLAYLTCILTGVFVGFAVFCWLLHRSHENFRKMFHATPKDK